MRRPLSIASVLLVLVALLPWVASERAAFAQFSFDNAFGNENADPLEIKPLAENASVPQGGASHVALKLTINSAFHIQSATPFDKDLRPLKAAITGTDGITVTQYLLPPPQIIASPPGLSATPQMSVYEGEMTILVPFTVSADALISPAKLKIVVSSQACTDKNCQPPAEAKFEIPVQIVAAGTPASPRTESALFDAALKSNTVAITLAPKAAPVAATAPAVVSTPSAMSTDDEVKLIESRNYHAASPEAHSLLSLILLALLGGLILNVMPCVLPVIPLKVLSIVQQAHGDRSKALMHSLAFSAGIVSLFMVLAILLRTFGFFYGQQFQQPGFLIGISLFIIAFSLSMLNVWTIQTPQAAYNMEGKAHGYAGSFVSGLAATLLATPCSAPYLGPVLAWALVQPSWVTALILGLVGVGMALPYVILAMMPKILDRIPRAGRWTEVLKQGLGIIMLGVALYLITRLPNAQYWPWALAAGILVSMVCWAWGQIPSPLASASTVWSIRVVVLIVGLGLSYGLYTTAQEALKPASIDQWKPFNMASLDAALKDGRPVVVDWTADWCINCKSLEAVVLSSPEVKKAFDDHKITLLRADLSSDNPPATAMNSKLGGQAIPALAIFSPAKPQEPTVLRDLYTQKKLLSALDRLN